MKHFSWPAANRLSGIAQGRPAKSSGAARRGKFAPNLTKPSTLRFWGAVVLLSVAIITAACTGIPRRDRDKAALDQYLKYAGPPVDRITYLGHFYNWQAVGQYQLVLWADINDAYLITVSPPCENLVFAQRIGLAPTANTIYARFDPVLVGHWRCMITEIRPINYKKMQQDLREQRAQEKADKAQQ